jgi:biopolymer transport protein ExbD
MSMAVGKAKGGAKCNINIMPMMYVVLDVLDMLMLKLNQDVIEESKLGDRLIEVFKTRAERVVFVKGDPDLDFQTVARAIDIAKGAAIDKVGLITPKAEAGE